MYLVPRAQEFHAFPYADEVRFCCVDVATGVHITYGLASCHAYRKAALYDTNIKDLTLSLVCVVVQLQKYRISEDLEPPFS